MRQLLRNWDLVRVLRIILAVSFIGYGISTKDYMLIFIGGLFGIQAILNISCCGAGGCADKGNSKSGSLYKGQIKEYKSKQHLNN